QPGVFNATKSDYDDLKFGDDNTTEDFSKYAPGLNYTQAWIETDAGGTRTVQFNTTPDTDDRQFTIRVQDPNDKNKKYDEVKVRVEKGAVTITASGTGTYYIGEEITLEGTCTEGDKVYLFITGPNLPSDGANPLKPGEPVIDRYGNLNFLVVDVEPDDTWSEKWNTADIEGTLDAGGYTIYAVSAPVDKSDLSDAEYDTISIQLRSGFISATSSGAVVAKGDDLKLTGVAQGDPSEVYIWIFGKNYYGEPGKLYVRSESVEDDGTFEYELKGSQTKELSAGQYFVVIQHPMSHGFEVDGDETTGNITALGMNPVKITNLQAAAAANALIKALDSPNIDDTYVKLTFVVEEPRILIDPIGDVPAGSTF
ncbi:MAG TPA: PGF-CTERM sorting domain-containing protein, partial [Methanoculleus thermophilus]|nr:PGF-CTERM sorting domain-containing protein [Methanoculleus thermophilus]